MRQRLTTSLNPRGDDSCLAYSKSVTESHWMAYSLMSYSITFPVVVWRRIWRRVRRPVARPVRWRGVLWVASSAALGERRWVLWPQALRAPRLALLRALLCQSGGDRQGNGACRFCKWWASFVLAVAAHYRVCFSESPAIAARGRRTRRTVRWHIEPGGLRTSQTG